MTKTLPTSKQLEHLARLQEMLTTCAACIETLTEAADVNEAQQLLEFIGEPTRKLVDDFDRWLQERIADKDRGDNAPQARPEPFGVLSERYMVTTWEGDGQ